MIKGKWKLLICTILVTCVLFMASNSVFAAINKEYYDQNVAGNSVTGIGLDNLLSNSTLTNALGQLIYGIAWLLETVLGMFFKLLTKTNMFPWADAILFNAIPFLDINIFNPSGASLVAQVQEFIAGTYYTVLTLASAFFGIAVMVSAVKLVLTAIAEDKARYKKAIVDWLLGLVMLWGIHFFISFALYLNEELVKVASTMATQSLEGAGDFIASLSDTAAYNEKLIHNFITTQLNDKATLWEIVRGILIAIAIVVVVIVAFKVVGTYAACKAAVLAVAKATGVKATIGSVFTAIGKGGVVLLTAASGIGVGVGGGALTYNALRDNVLPVVVSIDEEVEKKREVWIKNNQDLEKIKIFAQKLYATDQTMNYDGKPYKYNTVDVAAGLLKSQDYCEVRFPEGMKSSGFDPNWWETAADKKFISVLYYDVAYLLAWDSKEDEDSTEVEQLKIDLGDDGEMLAIDYYKMVVNSFDTLKPQDRVTSGGNINYSADQHKLYAAMVKVFDHYVTKQASETNIITNLASYFKETAWSTSETGWKANKSVVQNALMYAILVVQSLIFFIAYVKRLFYVLMLILMAPIVVVFDFFTKFGK